MVAEKKDRGGFTDEDYFHALEVIRHFREEWEEERKKEEERRIREKLPRKEGIKYIRCQHLKEKTQEAEQVVWWLGDSLRVVACPICAKAHMGNALATIFTYIRRNDPEIREILERGEDRLDRYKLFNETPKNEAFFKRLLQKSTWARWLFPWLDDETPDA